MSNARITRPSGGPGQKPAATMGARFNRAMDTSTPFPGNKTMPAPLHGRPIPALSFAIPSVEPEGQPSASRQTRSPSPAKSRPPRPDQANNDSPSPSKRASRRQHQSADVASNIQADYGDFAHLILDPLKQHRAEDNAVHERNLARLVDRIDTSHEAILATTKVGLAHFRATTRHNFEHMGEVLSANSQDLFQSVDANALRRHAATTASLDAVSRSVKTQHEALDVKVNTITDTLGTMDRDNTARDTTLRTQLRNMQGEMIADSTRTRDNVIAALAETQTALTESQTGVIADSKKTRKDVLAALTETQTGVIADSTKTRNEVNQNITQLNGDLDRGLQQVRNEVGDAAKSTQAAVTASINKLGRRAQNLTKSLRAVQSQANSALANQKQLTTAIGTQMNDVQDMIQNLTAASQHDSAPREGRANHEMDENHKSLEQQMNTTGESLKLMKGQLMELVEHNSAVSNTQDPRSRATDDAPTFSQQQFGDMLAGLESLRSHFDTKIPRTITFPPDFNDTMLEVREFFQRRQQPQSSTSVDDTQAITRTHDNQTIELRKELANERKRRMEAEQAHATASLRLDMVKTSHSALSERNYTLSSNVEDAQSHAHLFRSEFAKFVQALLATLSLDHQLAISKSLLTMSNREDDIRTLKSKLHDERTRNIAMGRELIIRRHKSSHYSVEFPSGTAGAEGEGEASGAIVLLSSESILEPDD